TSAARLFAAPLPCIGGSVPDWSSPSPEACWSTQAPRLYELLIRKPAGRARARGACNRAQHSHSIGPVNRNSSVQGALYLGEEGTRFRVWAPEAGRIEVKITSDGERVVPLERGAEGYHEAVVEGVEPGDRYLYVI